MSESLVINIFRHYNEPPVSSVYYSWSGYAHSMFQEIAFLIHLFRNEPCLYFAESGEKVIDPADFSTEDLLLRMICGLERSGGRLRESETNMQAAKNLYPDHPFSKDHESGAGFIALCEKDISVQNLNACRTAFIYLDTQTVHYEFLTLTDKQIKQYYGKDPEYFRLPDPFDFEKEIRFDDALLLASDDPSALLIPFPAAQSYDEQVVWQSPVNQHLCFIP